MVWGVVQVAHHFKELHCLKQLRPSSTGDVLINYCILIILCTKGTLKVTCRFLIKVLLHIIFPGLKYLRYIYI